jgi:triacylglycerol esterase/lipase EstA (alpha/beta hydrolase family)
MIDSVVLVPGLGTSLPSNWPFAQPDWIHRLARSNNATRTFIYEFPSPFNSTKTSWESLLMLGYDFLQQISEAQSRSHTDTVRKKQISISCYLANSSKQAIQRPIVIICHSLGGLIVKQALCIADKQFPRYEPIVNAIAGIIFLGVAHRCGDKLSTFGRFRDILETTTSKTLKIPSSAVEQEGAILLDLADRFEAISLRTPILSAYELRDSRNGTNPLRSRYQQASEYQY